MLLADKRPRRAAARIDHRAPAESRRPWRNFLAAVSGRSVARAAVRPASQRQRRRRRRERAGKGWKRSEITDDLSCRQLALAAGGSGGYRAQPSSHVIRALLPLVAAALHHPAGE